MKPTTVVAPAFVFVAIAGCAVPLETQPRADGGICRLARIGGVLVVDPEVGVGLRAANGGVQRVVWPHGYSARRDLAGLALVDADGRTVAREGNEIATAGYTREDGVAYPCGPVEVIR